VDLRRFLADEPILARPSTATYALRKFVRRNPGLVVGLGLAATSLVTALLLALGAARTEQALRREADGASRAAVRASYRAELAAAAAALRAGDAAGARRRLALAPADLRGWEWRHLDAATAPWTEERALATSAQGLSLSPDGQRLLTTDATGATALRATATPGDAARTLAGAHGSAITWAQGQARRLDPGPGGAGCASAGPDAARGVPRARGMQVVATALSPDGASVAAGWPGPGDRGTDPELVILDAATGEVRMRRKGPGARYGALGLAWSPDGRMLAVGGWDHAIRLLDARTGEELAAMRGHGGWSRALAFSPDGALLASGSEDHTVRVWTWRSARSSCGCRGTRRQWRGSCSARTASSSRGAAEDGTVRLWACTAARRGASCPWARPASRST
jgi:hypothetical protein